MFYNSKAETPDYLDKSAIILAVDSSSKFGEDKGLLSLDNKPLLKHVVDAVKGIAEEVIIVTTSEETRKFVRQNVSPNVQVCF